MIASRFAPPAGAEPAMGGIIPPMADVQDPPRLRFSMAGWMSWNARQAVPA